MLACAYTYFPQNIVKIEIMYSRGIFYTHTIRAFIPNHKLNSTRSALSALCCDLKALKWITYKNVRKQDITTI